MPGIFNVNLATYLGRQLLGWKGSVAALSGMLLPPVFILIVFATFFNEFRQVSCRRILPSRCASCNSSSDSPALHTNVAQFGSYAQYRVDTRWRSHLHRSFRRFALHYYSRPRLFSRTLRHHGACHRLTLFPFFWQFPSQSTHEITYNERGSHLSPSGLFLPPYHTSCSFSYSCSALLKLAF